MLELQRDQLIVRFPAIEAGLRRRIRAWVGRQSAAASKAQRDRLPEPREALYACFPSYTARVSAGISFQRTLRIPDDGKDYPLPPGLGCFPLRHVEDFPSAPAAWRKTGGVMFPMHRAEALWLSFHAAYPMALRVAAGGICAVSGQPWSARLSSRLQNYVVLPAQPWLDGFRVSDDIIRQFVAMPLGKGLTVERQLMGKESWGGLQLQAFPMREELYWRTILLPELRAAWAELIAPPHPSMVCESQAPYVVSPSPCPASAMGLGAGGRMRQEITADEHGLQAWDTALTSRCYVRLCLADDWPGLTGEACPTRPPTAQDYTHAGLPWFDYDHGQPPVVGSTPLAKVKSVHALLTAKTGLGLPDNESLTPTRRKLLSTSANRPVKEF